MGENGSNNINVKILFFGAARDAVGVEKACFIIAAPASVLTVKKAVFARYETLSVFAKSLMVAVNREYATDETAIENLDEIAFLPPVSGG